MKFLIYYLIILLSFVLFLSCGDGSINTPTYDDKTMLALYIGDETLLEKMIPAAMDSCMEDLKCYELIKDYISEPTSSSDEIESSAEENPVSSSSRNRMIVIHSSTSYEILSSSSVSPEQSNTSTESSTSTNGKFSVDDIEVDGTCKVSTTTIVKGSSVTATFSKTNPTRPSNVSLIDFLDVISAYDAKFAEYDCAWKVKDETISQACGTGTYTHAFPKPGQYDISVTIKEKDFTCGSINVEGAPITGCVCKPDNYKPDVVGGAVDVIWTVTGCTTNGTITDYDWDDVTGSGETATASFDTKAQTIKPSVTVINDDGTVKTFACDSAKAIDTSKPDYEIVKGETLEVPVGECGVATVAGNIRFEHPHEWQTSSCTITLTINGTEYTKSVSNCNVYYGILPCDGISVTAGTQICVNEVSSIYGKLKMKYQ